MPFSMVKLLQDESPWHSIFLYVSFATYVQLEKSAVLFRPKLIIAGASAYARLYDYDRMRKARFFFNNEIQPFFL